MKKGKKKAQKTEEEEAAEKKMRKSLMNKQLIKEAMEFFSKNSAHIEVVRNKNIEKVHFILLPYCHELPKVVISFQEK